MLLALSFLLVGCGRGSEARPVNVENLVFKAHDLPRVRGVGAPLPEPCGPISQLKEKGGRAALSSRFDLRDGEVVEAAAIFRGVKPARSAYRALNAPSRLRCIALALRDFTGQTVGYEQPRQLGIRDEAAVTRYKISDLSSGRSGYSNVVSLRVGRCTASILVASGDKVAAKRLMRLSGSRAAELFSRSCGA